MKWFIFFSVLSGVAFFSLALVLASEVYSTWFLPIYGLAFLPYVAACKTVSKINLSRKQLLLLIGGFALFFRLCLLFAPPALSNDIYRYLWDGLVFQAGFNPYEFSPNAPELSALATEYPYHSRINYPQISTIYPPMMQYLFRFVVSVSPSIFGLKLFFLLFDLGVIFLLYQLLKQQDLPLDRLLLYAWNPLPILEFSGNGHNDIVAIFFLLLALYYFTNQKFWKGTLFLSASFLSKIVGILAFFFLNPHRKPVLIGVFWGLVVLACFPFLDEQRSLFRGLLYYTTELRFNDSLFDCAFCWVEPLLTEYSDAITGTKFIFAVLMISLVGFSWKEKVSIFSGVYILLSGLMMFTTQLHPWYLGWILPFACFYRRNSWVLLSATVALSYLHIFSYHRTGFWYESPEIKLCEYLPFYAFWILEQIDRCKHSCETSWIRVGEDILKLFFLLNFLVLAGFLVFQGRINLDEGYLLTAAKRTQEGRILYQETAFTQGPVLPYVYGALLERFHYSFLSGRILTFGISLCTVAMVLYFSFAQGGGYALLITGFLLCWNLDYAYFSVIVKTYSLASFFLLLSILLFLWFPNKNKTFLPVLGIAWIAGGTRISVFPFFFFFLGYFWYRSEVKKQHLILWVAFLLGVSVYCFYPAPCASLYFHLIQFHLGFSSSDSWWHGKGLLLKYTYENFYAFFWTFFGLILCRLFWIKKPLFRLEERWILWITGFVALFHFLVKTGQPEYQTILYPIGACFIGIWGGRLLKNKPWPQTIWILMFLGYMALSGFEQGWTKCYGIRDERWAPADMIRYVRKCLIEIKQQHSLGGKVLSMDPLPVLESPFETFYGMEMGPFSFYPNLSSKELNRFGVINRETIERWVEQKEPDIILYTPDFFARENPSLQEMPDAWKNGLREKIQNHYEQVKSIGGYGQLHHTLEIYIRRHK